MAITWDIENDTHGRIVTCQRPILIGFYTEAIGASHFRVKLEIKDTGVDVTDPMITDPNWGWVDTGIRMNAYSDNGGDFYQCNLAPYVRNYFKQSGVYLKQDFCIDTFTAPFGENNDWNHMLKREFRARVWPVVYATDGTLVEEQSNDKFIREFMVFDTNIFDNETTSSVPFDNIRMDAFVTGNVSGDSLSNTYGDISYIPQRTQKLLTNMPGALSPEEPDPGLKLLTLNTNDGQFPIVGLGYSMLTSQRYKMNFEVTYLNGTVSTWGVYSEYGNIYPWIDTNRVDIIYYHTDLWWMDFCFLVTGVTATAFFDNNGDLNCSKVKIWVEIYDNSGTLVTTAPSFSFNVTDKKNDGHCSNKRRFIFKNSRGLFDWFTSYGMEEKTVQVAGSTYEKQATVSRMNGPSFVHKPGEHQISNLWNTRIEKYKVTTDLVPTEWAIWLEEMMTSPVVWVEEVDKTMPVEDTDETTVQAGVNWRTHQRLTPIIIDKASFKVYNTDDGGLHYVEFSYIKSNQNTTSKSF